MGIVNYWNAAGRKQINQHFQYAKKEDVVLARRILKKDFCNQLFVSHHVQFTVNLLIYHQYTQ